MHSYPFNLKKQTLIYAFAFLLAGISMYAARTHIVKKNETLSGIAHQHDCSLQELIAINDIQDPQKIYVGQTLKIPSDETPYTIKKGDTLSAIAKKHHVTVKNILRINPGLKPDKIYVGQEIMIPCKTTGIPSSPAKLDLSVQRSLARTRINQRKWKYIVLHHSATRQGTMKGMDRYHRDERRMKNGLAYHFVIGNGRGMGDGEIGIGNRWKRQIQGGHLSSAKLNHESIGICLIGNFMEQKPTEEQMKQLDALLHYLNDHTKVPIGRVMMHRSINTRPTICPGKYFPMQEVKAMLRRY